MRKWKRVRVSLRNQRKRPCCHTNPAPNPKSPPHRLSPLFSTSTFSFFDHSNISTNYKSKERTHTHTHSITFVIPSATAKFRSLRTRKIKFRNQHI
ncbi:hypothetical protein K7X08_031796 [Anisodus acutangulus]|uniref:Uncharacterized protein n=1 Tax=Anisodus acutangulus TaxID=402998 RepID=A0A9Q1RMG6_9SOLA|nr:hypothetical protein K7X08_031796 [Anisodus acutangulus]